MLAIEYAQQLIRFDSTWYRSNLEISDFVEQQLMQLGFTTERVEFLDSAGTRKCNVLGRRGEGPGGLAYFCHTDVVPADTWFTTEHGPFEGVVRDGRLYGRGSCDMKGSLACMLAAVKQQSHQTWRAPLYISCTADEEINHGGIDQVVQRSQWFRDLRAGGACGIVGEPTMLEPVYGHKGGCRIIIRSRGRAAHSSTGLGCNANLAMIPFLVEVKAVYDETQSDARWQNPEFQPPTICLNFLISDHTRAPNVTPPESTCIVAFRPMPGTDTAAIVERLRQAAVANGLEFQPELSLAPFYCDPRSPYMQTVVEFTGGARPRTVAYGSEASNLAELRNLVVLGPGSVEQAHTHDEWISLEQLERGTRLYEAFLQRYCIAPPQAS
ncbi:MAG: M20 family metallopeptidase [Pirellulaceae bacterium]